MIADSRLRDRALAKGAESGLLPWTKAKGIYGLSLCMEPAVGAQQPRLALSDVSSRQRCSLTRTGVAGPVATAVAQPLRESSRATLVLD